MSFLRLLRAPRAWFHSWRHGDDLHRECAVCGKFEQRDPDGDLMCDAPGAWYVVQSGNWTAHFRQASHRPIDGQAIGNERAPDVAHDVALICRL